MIKLMKFKCINKYKINNINFINKKLYWGVFIKDNKIKVWDESKKECIFQIFIPCQFKDSVPYIKDYFENISEEDIYLDNKKEVDTFIKKEGDFRYEK